MRKLTMILLIVGLFAVSGCTDTDRASWSAYGNAGDITCYSGGKEIYKGRATGRIQTVKNSDGWEFKEDTTGDFIRVSGDCVIRNKTR